MRGLRGFGSVLAAVPLLLLLPASASANDDLLRGLVGVGSAIILNQAQQRQQASPASPGNSPYRSQRFNRAATPQSSAAMDQSAEARAARAEIQRRLNLLGYNVGVPDGVYGARTRRAIAQFQRSIGRTPDGRLSRAEVSSLFAATGGTWPEPSQDASGGGAGTFPQLDAGGSAPEGDGGGAFPTLGAAPGEAPTAGGGFPKLGGEAGGNAAAAGGFPQLGAQQPAAGGSAFPTLGEPDEDGDTAAMPTLGKPAAPGAEGFPELERKAAAREGEQAMPAVASAPKQDNAFPDVAAPAEEAVDGSMPTLGKPAQDNAPAMPAVAAAPKQNNAFPDIAPPAEGDEPAMPAVAAAPVQDAAFPHVDAAEGDDADGSMPALAKPPAISAPPAAGRRTAPAAMDEATLDGELARTVYKDKAGQPTVSGVSLGQSSKDAVALLAAAGFSGCEATARPVSCKRDTATLSDAVTLWWEEAGGTWAMRRVITFKSPAPVDFVTKQFEAGYPELMRGDAKAIASSASCPGGRLPAQGLDLILERMRTTLETTSGTVPDDLLGYANACPLLYALGLSGQTEIGEVRLTFIDATPLIRRAAEARKKLEAEQKTQRDKLSRDLKL